MKKTTVIFFGSVVLSGALALAGCSAAEDAANKAKDTAVDAAKAGASAAASTAGGAVDTAKSAVAGPAALGKATASLSKVTEALGKKDVAGATTELGNLKDAVTELATSATGENKTKLEGIKKTVETALADVKGGKADFGKISASLSSVGKDLSGLNLGGVVDAVKSGAGAVAGAGAAAVGAAKAGASVATDAAKAGAGAVKGAAEGAAEGAKHAVEKK